MRGLVFAGDRQIDFIDVPDPTPGPGEVVLEMKASGICGSDLHMYRGPKGMRLLGVTADGPIIAGHEPCGIVAAVGPDVSPREAKIGARVMVHHYSGCNVCRQCRTGWAQMCEGMMPTVYGIGAHGGHATWLKVPARTLVHLPDELSFEAGAAISCGTGTSYQALKRLHIAAGEPLAIFGQGPVGLAGTQLAAAMAARVIAVDLSPERLALARAMGAQDIINAGSDDPIARIKDLTHGRGADYALEASGAQKARNAALACVKIWGVVGFVGISNEPNVDISPLMRRQVSVFGSWTFSNTGQADCATFAADHGVAVDRIFTDRWKLEQGAEAYRKVDAQAGGKGVFVM
jgi:threonine dehydrogenase-like Zn-dependent dehydrogenase